MSIHMRSARKIYEKEREFYEIVDHALTYGYVESTKDYFLLYYIIDKDKLNHKKTQNCLDNGKVFYVSLFAGDMKPFLIRNNFEWIAFRRDASEDLKCYNYDSFTKRVVNQLGDK